MNHVIRAARDMVGELLNVIAHFQKGSPMKSVDPERDLIAVPTNNSRFHEHADAVWRSIKKT